jgi:hypothetical protein
VGGLNASGRGFKSYSWYLLQQRLRGFVSISVPARYVLAAGFCFLRAMFSLPLYLVHDYCRKDIDTYKALDTLSGKCSSQ